MESGGKGTDAKERTIIRATVDGQRRQFDGRRLRPRGALFLVAMADPPPHKRLPRAAEYCIGCLKGLLHRRKSVLQREKEREVDMRGGGCNPREGGARRGGKGDE